MKVRCLILFLLFSISLCSERNIEDIPRPAKPLLEYKINLDDDPSVRFNHVLEDFKEKGHQIINEIFEKKGWKVGIFA